MSRPDGYLLPAEIDAPAILREVARGFNVAVDDILSDDRSTRICVARSCAMAVIREATELSYPEIGRLFGREHTTVMHHHRKVMGDPELSRSVRLVVEELCPAPRLFDHPSTDKIPGYSPSGAQAVESRI